MKNKEEKSALFYPQKIWCLSLSEDGRNEKEKTKVGEQTWLLPTTIWIGDDGVRRAGTAPTRFFEIFHSWSCRESSFRSKWHAHKYKIVGLFTSLYIIIRKIFTKGH